MLWTKTEPWWIQIVMMKVIENLQFHMNSDIDALVQEHGAVEEEVGENETEKGDITLGGDHLFDSDVLNVIQSVSNIENDCIINANFRSLNIKQHEVFDIVYKWTRDFVKHWLSKIFKNVPPFHK